MANSVDPDETALDVCTGIETMLSCLFFCFFFFSYAIWINLIFAICDIDKLFFLSIWHMILSSLFLLFFFSEKKTKTKKQKKKQKNAVFIYKKKNHKYVQKGAIFTENGIVEVKCAGFTKTDINCQIFVVIYPLGRPDFFFHVDFFHMPYIV